MSLKGRRTTITRVLTAAKTVRGAEGGAGSIQGRRSAPRMEAGGRGPRGRGGWGDVDELGGLVDDAGGASLARR
jgi:hypothetical protein